nr:MAG TPA: hypothetical protein [Caudoviricetes sp.]DAQ04856.1 MAG TPA: hypothetical protein [Caudoviricetes sp.]
MNKTLFKVLNVVLVIFIAVTVVGIVLKVVNFF